VALLAAALAIVLTGCAPHIVSVPVACIDAKLVPAEPMPVHDKLTGVAANDAATLAVSLLEWKLYGRELAALVSGCK
jgi:hypothetical protein